ncbi:LAETG motif-containing sortase-dependent surface protein [Streptomyces sp. ALI-76-A]|jgi:LPXTG-motif cell wall-anchored protein|uniref:LAETG motif-containing sortase-dependent surface protein n=1 Tax=Streptomyces sp. ALI-76-A TaxID=3025736 RepID=UPI00256EFBDE|nr:LAETG motif-containing sortase-dependent surface protein [Streptomyces sp. ALI-76-A]MDL5202738.1 LAETG motif-containing sortase-dependent surface protein [Streptomyces sp. ALI-76-A]
MSIARRVTARRLLGTGAAALVLCAVSAPTSWATGTPGGDGWKSGDTYEPGTGAGTETGTDRCQFSLDGTGFFDSVKVDDQNLRPTDDGKVHIKVRTAGDAATCTASLASYLAHGATFNTSGEQVFVDFDTVTVKPGQTESLDIAVPDAGCFAQIDLYRGAVKFDGELDAKDGFVHGDLPKGPDRPVIKDKLIAAWNGGTKDCTTAPSEPPATPTPTPSVPESTEPSTPAEETTPPATEPPASGTPTTEAPTTDAPTPSASESTTAPAPAPNGGGEDLAETGANSSTGPIAIGAAVLLAGGAGIVMATRRRKATRA